MDTIEIVGIDKAVVLQRLYNAARPQGMGFYQYTPGDMSIDEARDLILKKGPRLDFDYVKGRVLKVNLTNDSFSPALYDRDNGPGAARRAIFGY